MSEPQKMTEKLTAEFAENYMEQIFYFCLKKTGNSSEADDLTQDIALNVITELNKGVIPTSFSAWVWKIARNRYSKWANYIHIQSEAVTGSDIGDYEITDLSCNHLDEMIQAEQLSLLYRELAFIRSDYRNIIVAHYIDDKSLRSIAASLSLSENTVKQRLHRARKILKEGMNMAREFGVRSYKPEDIRYSVNCGRPGSKNQPYSIMEHSLYDNIMLEAYGNPSTAETLSMELGIALPYMEDELEYLTRENILIKDGDKYQTAFPIISSSAQEKIHNIQLACTPKITAALSDLVDRLDSAFKAIDYPYYGKFQDYGSAKWSLLMLAYDHFLYNKTYNGAAERPDNGKWDIIGYQQCSVPRPVFVGNHVSGFGFQQFKYYHNGIMDRTPKWLTDDEARVLHDFAFGAENTENPEVTAALEKYGYISKDGEKYRPNVLILNTEEIKNKAESLDKATVAEISQLAESAKSLLKDLYEKIADILKADLPEIFSKDERIFRDTVYCCYSERGYVMDEALRAGYLLPADKVCYTVGAHFMSSMIRI